MHIAHFTNSYHPVINGVVRSVNDFRKALTELGHNVFIFAQDELDYEDQEPFVFRYPSVKLPFSGDIQAAIPISAFIDQLLPSLKLDVIHAHHPILLGQAAANKADELNLPLVFTFHSQYREYSQYFPISGDVVQGFIKSAIDVVVNDFIKKCQHVIVPTASIRDILKNEYGLIDRVSVIPTGIDLRLYRNLNGRDIREQHNWKDDIVLISVGRLAPEKNWETLFEAVAQVMRTNSKVRLVLIGDGPDKECLKKLAHKLGIAEKVEFLGKHSFREVPRYLKAADLFVFASRVETQGLVTLEAMAAGLPVVAVDAVGVRDVIASGVDGLLTDDDSEALAAAIRLVLSSSDRIEHFKEAALEKVRSYDIVVQAANLVDVYQQAIEDRKAGRVVRILEPRLV